MWWGTQPAGPCACRYGSVVGLPDSLSRKDQYGIKDKSLPSDLVFKCAQSRSVKGFPSRRFHNLLPLACETRTSCFHPSHFQAERRRLSLVFESQHFLEDALDVCAASADPAAAVIQVCPCREWKNKTGGLEESWPALLIWHHGKRGWLCRLQWL